MLPKGSGTHLLVSVFHSGAIIAGKFKVGRCGWKFGGSTRPKTGHTDGFRCTCSWYPHATPPPPHQCRFAYLVPRGRSFVSLPDPPPSLPSRCTLYRAPIRPPPRVHTFVSHPSSGLHPAQLQALDVQSCALQTFFRCPDCTAPQIPVWRAGRAELENPRIHHHEDFRAGF